MLVLLAAGLGLLPAQAALQSVGFYYGADTRLQEFHAFDVTVVDPDHGFDPELWRRGSGELYAYVSVGEVHPSRSWAGEIPQSWKLGRNEAWASTVMDQRNPAWREFALTRIFAPLWQRGYRGFFLDTLDSYQLGGAAADPAAQQAGLVSLIRALRTRFPGIRLIANRGFELLPDIGSELEAIAAESLYRGWNQSARQYREVPEADREWLLARLEEAHQRYRLPVIVIDYLPPAQRAQMRDTARRILQHGFIPWVASGQLDTLGMSRIEVMPRRILILHDSREAPGMHYRAAHRYTEMLLNYLGYVADYADVNKPLPVPDPGVYAGLLSWFDGGLQTAAASRYERWLAARLGEGFRIAMLSDPGLPATSSVLGLMDLQAAPEPDGRVEILSRNAAIGYETEPLPRRQLLQPLRLAPGSGVSWLRLRDARGQLYDGAGITRQGGFVWRPFGVAGDDDNGRRWVIDPWRFLQQALALPAMPVPDTTSLAGRRMFFAHMDGDGFASRAEFPGSPFAAQVILDQVIRRYPGVPHTMSVIEGEVSPQGIYPKDSPAMEAIARRIFAQPNVEIASHTYSHPFRWVKVEAGDASADADADYHLDIPGYVPSLAREVEGSLAYVRTLAPAGKPVNILLWSGDAAPTPSAIAWVSRDGLLNMNGGSTMPTREKPSLTRISPLGARLGGHFQVFAPITNENVYTNLWRGPFYGFAHVTESFELTGEPRRIKPVDIYYHTYSGSKPAALRALQSAYDWALARPLHPVYASEFMRIATDFNTVVIARDLQQARFSVRNAGSLRSLRMPAELNAPALADSQGLAGWADGPDGRYLILSAAEASFALSAGQDALPRLAGANGKVLAWSREGDHIQARLAGHQPLDFELANAAGCSVRTPAGPLTGTPAGKLLRYRLTDAETTLDIGCRGR
ncbi:bifunctional glycoside hydrolase 114/ polysaccharide deacetylase family protein [Uliginosibacterium paludis]|uniref:Bifunctional glycoside hydrolase 114/ polysaccharide deacetylase family protein n=2 Tax=Uliginosibacterium paludis TaxID=1615952 RepID=A0ABV2CP48_9RHOO